MITHDQKRAFVNSFRAAEHAIEAVVGCLRNCVRELSEQGWATEHDVREALQAARETRRKLEDAHIAVQNEAAQQGEAIPNDDVIEPLGGGPKGPPPG